MIPVETSYFNFVDIGIIGICFIFVLLGYIRGLTKEFLSICSWGLATTISFIGVHHVSGLFENLIKISIIRYGVSFILLFVITLMFFLLLTSIAADKVAQTKLKDANKALGGIFGIIKAFIIVLSIMVVTIVFAPCGSVMDTVNASKIGPYIKSIALDCCVAMKGYFKSDDFKEICKYFDKDLPTIRAVDPAEEMKKLAVPQISKTVYNKDEHTSQSAKNAQEREDGYNSRRDKFIRRQMAIGQNEGHRKEDVHAQKPLKNKITAEALNNLVNE